jgi:hypothetical protein
MPFVRPFSGHRCLNHRAIFNTGAAAGAQIFFDTAGPFANFDLEFAGFAFNGFQVCVSD